MQKKNTSYLLLLQKNLQDPSEEAGGGDGRDTARSPPAGEDRAVQRRDIWRWDWETNGGFDQESGLHAEMEDVSTWTGKIVSFINACLPRRCCALNDDRPAPHRLMGSRMENHRDPATVVCCIILQ
jgi:hypothetical protein